VFVCVYKRGEEKESVWLCVCVCVKVSWCCGNNKKAAEWVPSVPW